MIHYVSPGEGYLAIATFYNVDVSLLRYANADRPLWVGQPILVPLPQLVTEPEPPVEPPVVEPEPEPPVDPEPEPPSAKPTPLNTGPTGPLTRSFGSTNITQAWLNTNNGGSLVLEDVDFTGRVHVRVDNLTLRNFKIDAAGANYGLYNEQFTSNISSGLVAEDGEIVNASSSLVLGSNMTLRRLYLHESDADAIKAWSNSTVEGCYVTRLGRAVGAHADGVQQVTGSDCVYRGNNFDMPKDAPAPYKSNAAFIIQTGNGPIDNVLIEGNWMNGGNFTVYVTDKGNGHGLPTNVRVRNNRFGRDFGFGIQQGGGTWTGNVWDDTGEPV